MRGKKPFFLLGLMNWKDYGIMVRYKNITRENREG